MIKNEERKIIETFLVVYCDICTKVIGEKAENLFSSNGLSPELSIKDVDRNVWVQLNKRHFHKKCIDEVCKLEEDFFEKRLV